MGGRPREFSKRDTVLHIGGELGRLLLLGYVITWST